MLSGTYAGVEAVDPAARDAARGVGMTEAQILWQVEFPAALPLLISGLRSAMLQIIATATIAAIVGIAMAFGIETIAEGIETAQQARIAAELGCGYGQGYLFGRAELHPTWLDLAS